MTYIYVLESYLKKSDCFRTLLPRSRISLSWAGCSRTSGAATQKEEMEAFVPLFCLIHTCAWMHLWYIFRTVLQVSMDRGLGWCVYYLTKEIVKESKIGFCASAQAIHSGRLTIYPTTEVQADSLWIMNHDFLFLPREGAQRNLAPSKIRKYV